MNAEQIQVYGTVQGVGFRPFIWQLARQYGIYGQVANTAQGVQIQAWATSATIDKFVLAITADKPPLAIIEGIVRQPLLGQTRPTDFTIQDSQAGVAATGVSADAATCSACLSDVKDPSNRRFGYPFTNCTHCGPRFSITVNIPYDRANTSMATFSQCKDCLKEYHDPNDRRFHAQPNACPTCGPTLWLEDNLGHRYNETVNHLAIELAAKLLANGKIIAIKGLGGFHLVCDATNTQAVKTLRRRKNRPAKPLALMAKDIAQVHQFAHTSTTCCELLQSSAAPVVLLEKKEPTNLAQCVAPGQNKLGMMLPYTAMHHWLLDNLTAPIVCTSGNKTDEPQCISNEQARTQLASIADYLLIHDREIVNRIDDSVLLLGKENHRSLRRARGYAPRPIPLPYGFTDIKPTFAAGADLKNTFCVAQNNQAIVSQHIGDLENYSTQQDYRKNFELYQSLYQFKPSVVAVDKHPNYFSTRFGEQLAANQDLILNRVQHHHAHIAALMVEAKKPLLSPPLLGIALDGLGYGDNDTLWGGEFLLVDYAKSTRLAHFQPVGLIGGNAAMKEPWRNALSHWLINDLWPTLSQQYSQLEIVQFLQNKPINVLKKIAEKQINSPPCSSAGRLFDAVAATLGICLDRQHYEGEAASQLQALAEQCPNRETVQTLPFKIVENSGALELNWSTFWPAFLANAAGGQDRRRLAWIFHTTLAHAIVQVTDRLAKQYHFSDVFLSGGVLQNNLLVELLVPPLEKLGFHTRVTADLPSNDGGIALGQVAVSLAQQLRQ